MDSTSQPTHNNFPNRDIVGSRDPFMYFYKRGNNMEIVQDRTIVTMYDYRKTRKPF